MKNRTQQKEIMHWLFLLYCLVEDEFEEEYGTWDSNP